jgi:hypothetical protein
MAASRQEKKYIAIQRARRRLENRLADIDWELDVLLPQLKELRQLEEKEMLHVELAAEGDDAEG